MMNTRIRTVLLALLVAAPLAASAQAGNHGGNEWRPSGIQGDNGWKPSGFRGDNGETPFGGHLGTVIGAVGGCGITDMPSFEAVIATKPTPSQFSVLYSCVQLVLPGDAVTAEMRVDNSRYFAELDSVGRIVGGSFR